MNRLIRPSLRTAMIIGTVLTLIKQFGAWSAAIAAGAVPPALALRTAFNFAVPFSASPYSRWALLRQLESGRSQG